VDLDKLKHLTDTQKDSFLKLERTFQSDGWQLVEEWAAAQEETAKDRVQNATSWDDFRLFKGAQQAFSLIRNLRETTEQQFEQLADANAEQVELEDEVQFE
jgi:hypothetical protein